MRLQAKKNAEKIIMEVEAGTSVSPDDCRGMALVYIALGNTEMTFKWLEKSYLNHEESLCSIRVDSIWKLISSDLRFEDLLKRIGLAF